MAVYSDPTVVTLTQPKKVHSGTWIGLMAGVLALLAAGFFYYQTQQLEADAQALDSQIASTKASIETEKPVAEELLRFDAMASDLTEVFGEQREWLAALSTFEQRLYKKMRVDRMQITDSAQVALEAYVTDYSEYAKAYGVFTDPSNSEYITDFKVQTVTKVSQATAAPGATVQASNRAPGIYFTVKFALGKAVLEAKDYAYRVAFLQSRLDAVRSAVLNATGDQATTLTARVTGLERELKRYQGLQLQEEVKAITRQAALYNAEKTTLTGLTDVGSVSRLVEVEALLGGLAAAKAEKEAALNAIGD